MLLFVYQLLQLARVSCHFFSSPLLLSVPYLWTFLGNFICILHSEIKSYSTASKKPIEFNAFSCLQIIIIKLFFYIFITFTSYENWTIYVIYIVILTGSSLCKLERQRIKFCVRHFGQFLSEINNDVNGNLPFLKFPLNLNCCI